MLVKEFIESINMDEMKHMVIDLYFKDKDECTYSRMIRSFSDNIAKKGIIKRFGNYTVEQFYVSNSDKSHDDKYSFGIEQTILNLTISEKIIDKSYDINEPPHVRDLTDYMKISKERIDERNKNREILKGILDIQGRLNDLIMLYIR